MNHRIERLIGREQGLRDVSVALRDLVRAYNAPTVGAMHITCADESEFECMEAFKKSFAQQLLPELKFAQRAPFHLSNLGARYEEGALAVAEHHYATPETQGAFKVLLAKINAHVAVEGQGSEATFGSMRRYDTDSTACGALHALLDDKDIPAVRELSETFATGRLGRLKPLRDASQVSTEYRSLFVSLVNARLQTQRVIDEILHHKARSPTVYLVASCLTLNRAEADTEVLCGLATLDQRDEAAGVEYVGLGDDPTVYRVEDEFGRLQIRDDQPSE